MHHGTTGNLDKYLKIAFSNLDEDLKIATDDIARTQETPSRLKGKLAFLPRLLKTQPKEPAMCCVARKRAAE